MPTQKRSLPPRNIHRFNYWEFFCPGGLKIIAPVKQHIQHQFNLLLNASPAVWNEEVRPWLHKEVSAIRNRPLYALKYYVECDKEWGWDERAQEVLRQLSYRQKAAVHRHFRQTWPERSKRPARLERTWKDLFSKIAQDVETFERFCETPPGSDQLSGTEKRIYLSYSKQAIKLLGGGTYIPKTRRNIYRDLLDDSDDPETLLTSSGRLPSKSIFTVNWLNLSRKDRRDAKKRTLHWFRHALRNLREYRYGRPDVPWSSKCENKCRQVQEKLRTP